MYLDLIYLILSVLLFTLFYTDQNLAKEQIRLQGALGNSQLIKSNKTLQFDDIHEYNYGAAGATVAGTALAKILIRLELSASMPFL